MKHPCERKRTAHTLVEMVVVMSVAVVVLSLSVTYLHRMISISSQSAKFLDAERTGLRFSRQFRQDALLASTAIVVKKPGADASTVLELECPHAVGGDVEYRFSPARVVRLALVSPGGTAREEYEFPAGTLWTVEHEATTRRVTLEAVNPPEASIPIELAPPPAWRVPFEMHVTAVLGRLTPLDTPAVDDAGMEVTE